MTNDKQTQSKQIKKVNHLNNAAFANQKAQKKGKTVQENAKRLALQNALKGDAKSYIQSEQQRQQQALGFISR